MKKSLILSIMLCLACGMQAKKWTARDVVAIINKVNNYWQANNKAEVRSFMQFLKTPEAQRILAGNGLRL